MDLQTWNTTHAADADETAQERALREGAAVWIRDDWHLRRVSGADRLAFLHKYCTQEIRIDPGRGAYGCVLTVKGAMVGDLWAFVRDDDLMVATTPSAAEGLFKHLSRYALFDKVTLDDVSAEQVLISVWGPKARACLEAAALTIPGEAPLEHCATARDGEQVLVARNDAVGVVGYDVILPRAIAPSLLDALCGAGAVRVDDALADRARVEAGVPLYGVDMDSSTIPLEAGLGERAINFDKGCYMGQEVIARISHRGRPAKHLRGLRLADGVEASAIALPAPLFAGDKEVGTLTSCVDSSRLGTIGLGTIKRKHAEAGTELKVSADGPLATVSDLPFA